MQPSGVVATVQADPACTHAWRPMGQTRRRLMRRWTRRTLASLKKLSRHWRSCSKSAQFRMSHNMRWGCHHGPCLHTSCLGAITMCLYLRIGDASDASGIFATQRCWCKNAAWLAILITRSRVCRDPEYNTCWQDLQCHFNGSQEGALKVNGQDTQDG